MYGSSEAPKGSEMTATIQADTDIPEHSDRDADVGVGASAGARSPHSASSSTTYVSVLETPIGELLLRGDADTLQAVDFVDGRNVAGPEPAWRTDDTVFARAREQLRAYFAGELRRFELALAPRGSAFQMRVWEAVRRIPYGETSTYGVLAKQLGRPSAFRAVGAANGRNPISIIIPCHRVLGADGGLTGYGGGVQRKEWLLAHERRA